MVPRLPMLHSHGYGPPVKRSQKQTHHRSRFREGRSQHKSQSARLSPTDVGRATEVTSIGWPGVLRIQGLRAPCNRTTFLTHSYQLQGVAFGKTSGQPRTAGCSNSDGFFFRGMTLCLVLHPCLPVSDVRMWPTESLRVL